MSSVMAGLFVFAGFSAKTQAQIPYFSTKAGPTGSITVTEYRGIGGSNLNDLKKNAKFPSTPDHKDSAKYFEWPQTGDIARRPGGNIQDQYGWMLEGYLFPPRTGKYCFYLCSDDNGELYLSTDSNPANKKLIATEPRWNARRNFKGHNRREIVDNSTGRRQNISGPIDLEANKPYYIQALVKEGGGGDNLSVAWFTPDNGNDPGEQFNKINPKIIPGKYLAGIDSELVQPIIPLEALIGFYPFDNPGNPLEDVSGAEADLESVGADPSFDVEGGFTSGGFLFDGTQRLVAPIDINKNKMPELTMGAWVKTSTLSPGLRKVMGHDNGGWDRTIGLDPRTGFTPKNGDFRYTSFIGNGRPVLGTPGPENIDNWTFMAAVYDQSSNQVTVYVDIDAATIGDSLASVTEPTDFGQGHATVSIGSLRPDNPAEGWQGYIDNAFFFAAALSADQITQVRNSIAVHGPPVRAEGDDPTNPDQIPELTFVTGAGQVQYTLAEFLQKDFEAIQKDTNGGRDDFYIIGLIPGYNIKGPDILKGDLCWTIPQEQLGKFKKLGMQEVKACFNLVDQTVSANLKIQPKFLKGGGTISGSFVAGEMGLRDIGILGENLMIPIGTTPAKLQKVGARVNDLHLNPGWFIDGELGISVGPAKIGDLWPVFVDSKATWHSNGYLQISAALQIIGIETGFGLIRYTPAESLFYAEAYDGDVHGRVQRGGATQRPPEFLQREIWNVDSNPPTSCRSLEAWSGAGLMSRRRSPINTGNLRPGYWLSAPSPIFPKYVCPRSMFATVPFYPDIPTSKLKRWGSKAFTGMGLARLQALLPGCLYPCDNQLEPIRGSISTSDTTRKTASALDRMVAA